MAKVHRANRKNTIRHIKSVTIPYDEIIAVLEEDGVAFLEADSGYPLRRQTIWKAAKRLSEALGKKVHYYRALFRVDGVGVLEGYSFSLEDPESQERRDTS